MRSWCATALLAGALGGCGPTEDFSVGVKQSPAEVVAAIGDLDFSREKELFGSFEVAISRPSDREIVYTMPVYETPDRTSGKSVIHLALEPLAGGSSTRIHAKVDVPAVSMMMGEPNKVLSEHKVENELRTVLARSASAQGLHDLLTAVAIASSSKLQSQVNVAELERENPGAVDWGSKHRRRGERPRYEAASAADDRADEEPASDDWGVHTRH